MLVVATAPASGVGEGGVVRGMLLSTPEWEFEEQAVITPGGAIQDACLQQLQVHLITDMSVMRSPPDGCADVLCHLAKMSCTPGRAPASRKSDAG